MPATHSLVEVRRFCEAVQSAGGEVPGTLANLVRGADLVEAHTAAQTPLTGLVEQLASGRLDAKKLSALVETAAKEQMIANYVGGLRPAVEPAIVRRFHAELKAGAADQILDSLRDQFDAAAAAIARAKSVIGSGESSPEHVLATGTAETVEAWQQLPRHIATVASIAAIASQFGCRQTSTFSLVQLYNLADNFKIDDRALAVTSGGLVSDSALMMRPDRGHTSSPFYRCGGLKLHSVAEMQARYDTFAAAEFDRVHADRPRGGRIGENGVVQLDEIPANPYRQQQVSAS